MKYNQKKDEVETISREDYADLMDAKQELHYQKMIDDTASSDREG